MRFSRLLGFPLFALALAFAASARAQIETPAKHAILMDFETGEAIFAKDADEPMPPASMSKLMTTELVFKRLKDGSLKLTDTMRVSEKAWRMGGSKMWVLVGNEVSVEDLLRGIVIQSGNDACIVMAEALGGSEEAFAGMMNARARELGLTRSHFTNATGWPDPMHRMSAHDLARLTAHMIRTYPDYYRYYAEKEFTWADIRQPNRNPLLYMDIGADGVKTGHTEESGYGLVASAVRDGRRLILVVNGLQSEDQRGSETRRLLDLGFREFQRYDLFAANDTIGEAEIWGGTYAKVPLKLAEPLSVNMLRASRGGLTITLRYQGPVSAPVAEGQEIGRLDLAAPGWPGRSVPVYAAAAVPETGLLGKMLLGLQALLAGDRAT